ncbi:MAG: hypothetical protein CSA38_02370 [Flavobacteriales bacterium]|nr:MAG: hypothetical protein CSA38_02370 [Flavobacteriales bacterium]
MNVEYDYRKDSKCGDPDIDSLKLYNIQKILWSKVLPNKQHFNLTKIGNSGRLLLKNNLIDNLSSDRMCPHFVNKYNGKFKGWISEAEEEEFKRKVRTIGGHIVFPAHRKDGFTINQARGINRKICDRFDLTLECIRRFYEKEKSPLYKTLKRYSEFFDIFLDFKGFVDFFLLQDFVNKNYQVLFTIPFDDFERKPLPLNANEYQEYKSLIIEQIDKRNLRVLRGMNKKVYK